MVKGAIIAQRKLEICCKFRWEFYPKTHFFPPCAVLHESLALWLVSGWISDISPWREKHSHQILLPRKKKKKKNSACNNQSPGRQIGTVFFFPCLSLQPLFYFLLEIGLQTWVTIHKYLVVLCCKKPGRGTQKKVILNSFAFTHANKLYASQ